MALAVATMWLLQGCQRPHDPPTSVVQLARQARDLPQTLEVVLDGRGYDSHVRVVQEGHNVQTWRAHLDDVLVPFFGQEASR